MDRGELLDALDEIQGRLDVAPLEDDEYTSLSDSVKALIDLIARRKL